MQFKLPIYLTAALMLAFTSCKKNEAAPEPEPEPQHLKPTVTTKLITDITPTTAICQGAVTSEGSSPVTRVGVCWDTDPAPTQLSPHADLGAGSGNFKADMMPLKPGTKYYVRTYATNAEGTSFGEELSFITAQTWSFMTAYSGGALINLNGKAIYRADQYTLEKSPDGFSWSSVCGTPYYYFGIDLFSSGFSNYVRSSDNGVTWTNITPPSSSGISRLIGQNSQYIFIVDYDGNIMKSSDNGSNWTPVSMPGSALNASSGTCMNNVMFVDFYDNNFNISHYVSNDGGATWTSTTVFPTLNFNGPPTLAAVGNTVYFSTSTDLYSTADGGKNFQKTPVVLSQLIGSGDKLYAVNTTQDVVMSADGGKTWTTLAEGFIKVPGASTSISISNGVIYAKHSSVLFSRKL
jgi:photosystem II stability/assembly factor-like uncharacterized protein